ncbi:MAG: hypothetical protein IKD37_05185 [Clostridia bacterium]|nr:hypothetical protein [Clostridia bacterium]
MDSRDEALLCARLTELDGRAEKGTFCYTRYLTPHELAVAFRQPAHSARFAWGGWAEAERKRIFFVPDYAGEPEENTAEGWLDLLAPLFGEELDEATVRVQIQGSGFRTLAHRDYLGAILGLGLERAALGDVVVCGDNAAAVFCDEKIAQFLETALERIGADRVRVSRAAKDAPLPPRATRPIHDTVASPRLDCVVAALLNLSREKAQTMIRSGEVEVNFLSECRTDVEICAGDMLSLRGYGRFRIRDFDGTTKRGRLRLSAEQFV